MITGAEAEAACAEAARLGLEEGTSARVLAAVVARDAILALAVMEAVTDGDPQVSPPPVGCDDPFESPC
jgi:hypothetical protein